uniref:Phosducin domain-containing protein n=1 Tax=Elaeophora elaphi TaxID=1147741 RepID=A0A0R3RVX3_9BILA
MADLETKLLYSDTAGYCSSSDDDDDVKVDKIDNATQRHHNEGTTTNQLMPRNHWNTGPKGVLEDYRIRKAQLEEEESKRYEEIVAQAKRCTLSDESVNDNLEEIRKKRLLEMKDRLYAIRKISFSFIFIRAIPYFFLLEEKSFNTAFFLQIDELKGKEQYIDCIESSRNRWVLIHIYDEDNEGCITLNKIFNTLAVRHPNLKLARVLPSIIELSPEFRLQALPALQVYRDDVLVGNFIRITDQLGEDFTADQLIRFLSENEIELELSKYPTYAGDCYGDGDNISIDSNY